MFIGGSETLPGSHHFPHLIGKSLDEIKTFLISQGPKQAIIFQFHILSPSGVPLTAPSVHAPQNSENPPAASTAFNNPQPRGPNSNMFEPFAPVFPQNNSAAPAGGLRQLQNSRFGAPAFPAGNFLGPKPNSPLVGSTSSNPFQISPQQWGLDPTATTTTTAAQQAPFGLPIQSSSSSSSAPRSPTDPEVIGDEDLPQVNDEGDMQLGDVMGATSNVVVGIEEPQKQADEEESRKRPRQSEGPEAMNISRNDQDLNANIRDSDVEIANNSSELSFEQVNNQNPQSKTGAGECLEPAAKRKRTESSENSSNNMDISMIDEKNIKKETESANDAQNKAIFEEKIAVLEQKCKENAQTIDTCKNLKEFASALEEEITCVICQDLVLHATTLHCSHTFCRSCIQKWLQKSQICPVCRSKITQKPIKNVLLENIIEKYVLTLTENERSMRDSRISSENHIEEVEISKLQSMLSAAKKKGARFLKIGEKWNEEERDTFLKGIEKYHGKARIIYCEVCGLTEKLINKCQFEDLAKACDNLGLKVQKKKNPADPNQEVPDVQRTREAVIAFIQQGWVAGGLVKLENISHQQNQPPNA